MRLSLGDFDRFTLRQLINAYDGLLELEEHRQRHDYNVARLLARYIAAPHMKKGARFDLTFPWEETPRQTLTPEQVEHLSRQIDKAAEQGKWEAVEDFIEIQAKA